MTVVAFTASFKPTYCSRTIYHSDIHINISVSDLNIRAEKNDAINPSLPARPTLNTVVCTRCIKNSSRTQRTSK